MCQTRHQASSGQGGLYPDLSGVQGDQAQQAEQTILHFLQALGLVPPPAPTQPTTSPPTGSPTSQPHEAPAAGPTNEPTAPPQPAAAEQANPQQQQQQQQQPQSQASYEGYPCPPPPPPHHHHQHGHHGHQASPPPPPFPGFWWNPENWNNGNQWNCNRRTRRPACSDQDMQQVCNFFKTIGRTIKTIFRNSMLASTTLFTILLIHFLAPVCLLQNLLFLVFAGSLGLHLPTLVAGRVLYSGLGWLGAAEPVLLVGLLVWAGHKIVVRRQPLFEQGFWTNRFNNLRVVINNRND